MKKGSFFIGAIVGSVLGGVAAVLSTPKSGRELRKDIKEESEKFYYDSKNKYGELSETAKKRFEEESKKIKELYDEKSVQYTEEMKNLKNKFLKKEKENDTETTENL